MLRLLTVLLVSTALSCTDQPQTRKPEGGPHKTASDPETRNTDLANKVKTYLDEDFGVPGYETTWHRHILRIEVDGPTVVAHTDLEGSVFAARNICSALSSFVFSNENSSLRLENVRVVNESGVLIDRTGLADKCQ